MGRIIKARLDETNLASEEGDEKNYIHCNNRHIYKHQAAGSVAEF